MKHIVIYQDGGNSNKVARKLEALPHCFLLSLLGNKRVEIMCLLGTIDQSFARVQPCLPNCSILASTVYILHIRKLPASISSMNHRIINCLKRLKSSRQ